VTSFDARGESKSGSNDIYPPNGVDLIRKSRSVENLAQPNRVDNGISQAGARLRSTKQPANPRSVSTGRRKGRSDTDRYNPKLSLDSFDIEDILNEFDNLLISALERAAVTAGDASYEPANIGSTSSTKQSSTPQTTLRHSRGQGFTKRLPVSLT
jgi:hypothetical protein